MTAMSADDINKLFCMMGKKYGIERALLKAVAIVESSLQQFANRFEPAFWDKYMKDKDEWKDRDPKEVSSSYGLMQIMYTTAVTLGYEGPGDGLYDPVVNIGLGAKLLAKLRDDLVPSAHFKCWPIEIILARYNGGSYKNPDENGMLRNYSYTRKVLTAYWSVREKETECDK